MRCPECKGDIERKGDFCPHCGHRFGGLTRVANVSSAAPASGESESARQRAQAQAEATWQLRAAAARLSGNPRFIRVVVAIIIGAIIAGIIPGVPWIVGAFIGGFISLKNIRK